MEQPILCWLKWTGNGQLGVQPDKESCLQSCREGTAAAFSSSRCHPRVHMSFPSPSPFLLWHYFKFCLWPVSSKFSSPQVSRIFCIVLLSSPEWCRGRCGIKWSTACSRLPTHRNAGTEQIPSDELYCSSNKGLISIKSHFLLLYHNFLSQAYVTFPAALKSKSDLHCWRAALDTLNFLRTVRSGKPEYSLAASNSIYKLCFLFPMNKIIKTVEWVKIILPFSSQHFYKKIGDNKCWNYLSEEILKGYYKRVPFMHT